MKTLIQELQDKVLNEDCAVLDVLRLSLYVSRKLKLLDFERWVNSELNGYVDSEEVPLYRSIPCRLKGFNHIRREWQPIDFSDIGKAELFAKTPLSQPIGELEKLSADSLSKNSMLIVHLPVKLENQIKDGLCSGCAPQEIALHIDSRHVMGIVDKVKSLILKWALDLEEAGVMGEGRNFSDQEKKSAKAISITNNNYNGEVQSIIQSMQNSQLLQGNRGSTQSFTQKPLDVAAIMRLVDEIKKDVDSLDLTTDKKAEIDADFSALNAQVKSPNPKVSIIKEALYSLRNIFENITGEVGAAVLIKLSGICEYITGIPGL